MEIVISDSSMGTKHEHVFDKWEEGKLYQLCISNLQLLLVESVGVFDFVQFCSVMLYSVTAISSTWWPKSDYNYHVGRDGRAQRFNRFL